MTQCPKHSQRPNTHVGHVNLNVVQTDVQGALTGRFTKEKVTWRQTVPQSRAQHPWSHCRTGGVSEVSMGTGGSELHRVSVVAGYSLSWERVL